MKRLITLCVVLVAVALILRPAFALISRTQGETKILGYVSRVYNSMESSGQEVERQHNRAKDYVQNNPDGLEQPDKTKLSGLNALIADWQAKKQLVLDYIDAEFVGHND